MALHCETARAKDVCALEQPVFVLLNDKSRMKGDFHVRFREKFAVKLLLFTRLRGRRLVTVSYLIQEKLRDKLQKTCYGIYKHFISKHFFVRHSHFFIRCVRSLRNFQCENRQTKTEETSEAEKQSLLGTAEAENF